MKEGCGRGGVYCCAMITWLGVNAWHCFGKKGGKCMVIDVGGKAGGRRRSWGIFYRDK